jgi:hypothetical protein
MRPLFLFIASAIIPAATATLFPDVLLQPGQLMKGHQTLQKECLSCHTPFSGTASFQCLNCHKQSTIGIKNVAGALLPKDTSKVLFHRGVSSNSCINCHDDHKGAESAKALKPFMHDALSSSLQKECITCHKNQKPEDNIHLSAKENCLTCHTRKHWKPATFDHNKHFMLDNDHLTVCSACHTDPADFKTYTCYKCHEHSPSRIASEHREEGIYNYQNCVKCHRSTSDVEWGSGYQEKQKGNREHDEDDD